MKNDIRVRLLAADRVDAVARRPLTPAVRLELIERLSAAIRLAIDDEVEAIRRDLQEEA